MTQSDKAKAGVIVGGAVVVLAGVGWLVWEARKGLGDLFKGAGTAAKDVAAVVTDVTGAASDVSSFGTSFVDPTQGASKAAPKASEFSADLGQLRLRTYDKKDSTPGISKKTTVSFEVLDPLGRGVPYATITGIPNKATTRASLGSKIVRVTDSRGRYTGMEWTVVNLAGTDSEDDITFVARAPGFNPSPEVTVK